MQFCLLHIGEPEILDRLSYTIHTHPWQLMKSVGVVMATTGHCDIDDEVDHLIICE
jgi:hypothetical protein